MVFARLLTQFKKKLDSQPDLFLALELTDETVKSAFWQPAAEGCRVIAYGSVEEWQKDQPHLHNLNIYYPPLHYLGLKDRLIL